MQEYTGKPHEATPIDESDHPEPGRGPDGPLLVNRCISQRNPRNPVLLVELYPRGVRLFRDGKSDPPAGAKRMEISSFSPGSKRRLRWTASNAFPALISQFALTYHQRKPDGRTVKAHLNKFLIRLRDHFPCGYLWILEFQRRGFPHIHLFLTISHETPGLHEFLARTWNRIAEPESGSHYAVHRHHENFIKWEMGAGSYLCKYLDKAHQKAVPEGFTGVGRFWAASRGIVPPPDILDDPGIKAVRTICRHYEKSLRGSKWKSSARRSRFSFRLPNGAAIAKRLISEGAWNE